jgi:hypothetical protein
MCYLSTVTYLPALPVVRQYSTVEFRPAVYQVTPRTEVRRWNEVIPRVEVRRWNQIVPRTEVRRWNEFSLAQPAHTVVRSSSYIW